MRRIDFVGRKREWLRLFFASKEQPPYFWTKQMQTSNSTVAQGNCEIWPWSRCRATVTCGSCGYGWRFSVLRDYSQAFDNNVMFHYYLIMQCQLRTRSYIRFSATLIQRIINPGEDWKGCSSVVHDDFCVPAQNYFRLFTPLQAPKSWQQQVQDDGQ